MSLQKYSGLLKRRRRRQMLGFTRDRTILPGRLVQRCRRPGLGCVRQRARRCAVLTSTTVKSRLQCARSEWRTATGACRIGRLNLRLFVRNRCIQEENERLRKQASLLSEENKLLRFKLQQQVRTPGDVVQS